MSRSVDVTGLPDGAIAAVEQFVSELETRPVQERGIPAAFASREEWRKAIGEWARDHSAVGPDVDWSRENAYAGCGE